ncbi:MAG TPA: cytochrome P460 family protein [Chitinophagaceae bacterium]|nr:cytochrome P460 family protein [Chitinophagaceae bacterium]
MKNIAKRKWIRVMVLILAVFGVIQFIRPEITSPATTADVISSYSVKMVLRRACYNCHSKAVISSAVRTDNGTTKIIMGNDPAVKALKSNLTNPWPDSTAFAKLTWVQTLDSASNIATGEFKQIAWVIKDAIKYISTSGWHFRSGTKAWNLERMARLQCLQSSKRTNLFNKY